MKKVKLTFILAVVQGCLFAQVDQIKGASSSHASGGRESKGNSGGVLFDVFFNVMLDGIIQAQQQKLQGKHEVPGLVSLEVVLQGAAQPSSYYILTPRMRANWGLFSSDYRINYLLEEGIDEVRHIRTNDWQVLQLNLVTTRRVRFAVGGGFMQEAYGGGNVFGEYTAALLIHPSAKRVGGAAEYRSANARRELNASVQYALFDKKFLHAFLTAGFIWQRYYGEVNVWGFQGGMVFRAY